MKMETHYQKNRFRIILRLSSVQECGMTNQLKKYYANNYKYLFSHSRGLLFDWFTLRNIFPN